MGRGGRRPGAGAPKGNLNGFKHGRNSQQYRHLLELIARDPEAVIALRDYAERNRRRQERLKKRATVYLLQLLDRLNQTQQELATARQELNQTFRPVSFGKEQ
jgi:hypothetical protein